MKLISVGITGVSVLLGLTLISSLLFGVMETFGGLLYIVGWMISGHGTQVLFMRLNGLVINTGVVLSLAVFTIVWSVYKMLSKGVNPWWGVYLAYTPLLLAGIMETYFFGLQVMEWSLSFGVTESRMQWFIDFYQTARIIFEPLMYVLLAWMMLNILPKTFKKLNGMR